MLGSALAADPDGGVELIRWILRTNLPPDLFKEDVKFKTREEFRAWFDDLRRKAAVE